MPILLDYLTIELAIGRAGPKLARFFWAKILTAQPALKTGLVRPNSLLKAKKIPTDRAGPGHTRQGHIGSGQIWPSFFRANNLMAQPSPNSWWTGLAHRFGPILPPLLGRVVSTLGLGQYTLAWVGSHCGSSFLVGSVPQLPS